MCRTGWDDEIKNVVNCIIMNCVHFFVLASFTYSLFIQYTPTWKAWSVFHIELLAIETIACLILSYKKYNLEHIFRRLLYIDDLSALSYLTIYLLIYVRNVGETKSKESYSWKTEWQRETHADTYEIKKKKYVKEKR